MTSADDDYIRRLIRREKTGERFTIEIGPHSVVVLSWVVRWASHRPQLVEWAPEIFAAIQAELAGLLAGDPDGEALRRRGRPVAVRVGPSSAFMLLGAIEWWVRQPRHAEHGPVFLDPVVDALTGLFDPAGLEIIQRLSRPPGTDNPPIPGR